MNHTIDFLYSKLLSCGIYAGNGRVNYGCRSAGLSNYNVSSHFDIISLLQVQVSEKVERTVKGITA